MKLVATNSELAIIRAATSRKVAVAGLALSSVDETYFHNKFTRVAYRRILKSANASGHLPTWTELLDDPSLSEDVRRKLKDSTIDKLRTTGEVMRTVHSLNKYRQLRGLYQMTEDVVTGLNKKSVDPDVMLTDIAETIVRLRQNKAVEHTVLNFGVGNNSTEMVKSLMEPSEPDFIPTGFDTFDSRNGGFGWGNLVVLGGTTGGGKCLTHKTNLIVVKLVKVTHDDGTTEELTPQEYRRKYLDTKAD